MTHEETITSMRATADTLEKFNDMFDHNIHHGTWSPHELRYQADYLEAHP